MGTTITKIKNLDFARLSQLLNSVFAPTSHEKDLAILVDLPSRALPDSEAWRDRRLIAFEWYAALETNLTQTPFRGVKLYCYENVGSNNNDLPETVYLYRGTTPTISIESAESVPLHQVLSASSVVLAMTELSATAPLKVLAKRMNFRGATLPNFLRSMIPALGLDYEKVNARVMEFKQRLDSAEYASITFSTSDRQYDLYLDLRFRTAHASGGIIREPGSVANLPSGEAYIVPYEGEKPGEPSRTNGQLPVQFADELVVYEIQTNRAVGVLSHGKNSELEKSKLAEEPAYGNLAELGIGVLGEWGVTAVGSTLLDEKLGLHIAFGRSEHFGGVTSPASFRDPRNVVHIDRVYVESCQPLISVEKLEFTYGDGSKEAILRMGRYLV